MFALMSPTAVYAKKGDKNQKCYQKAKAVYESQVASARSYIQAGKDATQANIANDYSRKEYFKKQREEVERLNNEVIARAKAQFKKAQRACK